MSSGGIGQPTLMGKHASGKANAAQVQKLLEHRDNRAFEEMSTCQ